MFGYVHVSHLFIYLATLTIGEYVCHIEVVVYLAAVCSAIFAFGLRFCSSIDLGSLHVLHDCDATPLSFICIASPPRFLRAAHLYLDFKHIMLTSCI